MFHSCEKMRIRDISQGKHRAEKILQISWT